MANRSSILGFLFAVAVGPLSLLVHAQAGHSSEVSGRAPTVDDFEETKELLERGLLEEAAAAAKRGLNRAPGSVEGLNLLGVVYHRQGKYDQAIRVFEGALSINPRSVNIFNNLATGYAAQNKADLAEKMFRKSLLLAPENPTANYNLGVLLLERNQPKESILHLRRIRHPDVSARLGLVRAYLSAGTSSSGVAAAESLSKDFPKDAKLHFSLGAPLASHRQYQIAIREFELANALQPQTFEILHDLGQAYLLNGQPAKAQGALDQAIHLQGDSADALYLLARAASDMRRGGCA